MSGQLANVGRTKEKALLRVVCRCVVVLLDPSRIITAVPLESSLRYIQNYHCGTSRIITAAVPLVSLLYLWLSLDILRCEDLTALRGSDCAVRI